MAFPPFFKVGIAACRSCREPFYSAITHKNYGKRSLLLLRQLQQQTRSRQQTATPGIGVTGNNQRRHVNNPGWANQVPRRASTPVFIGHFRHFRHRFYPIHIEHLDFNHLGHTYHCSFHWRGGVFICCFEQWRSSVVSCSTRCSSRFVTSLPNEFGTQCHFFPHRIEHAEGQYTPCAKVAGMPKRCKERRIKE